MHDHDALRCLTKLLPNKVHWENCSLIIFKYENTSQFWYKRNYCSIRANLFSSSKPHTHFLFFLLFWSFWQLIAFTPWFCHNWKEVDWLRNPTSEIKKTQSIEGWQDGLARFRRLNESSCCARLPTWIWEPLAINNCHVLKKKIDIIFILLSFHKVYGLFTVQSV